MDGSIMADATIQDGEAAPKAGKMPLIIGLVLALLGAGGGFMAVNLGLIFPAESHTQEAKSEKVETSHALTDIAFVPMDPLTITLPRSSKYDHLRFRGELEVVKGYAQEVESTLPRIIDVLNTYLRALEVADIEQAASLSRLRSQMLRRVQIVAGPGRVNDLLIMEFVLN
jgi:flagellar FliL protein